MTRKTMTVGVIGIGVMGSAIATRLLGQGVAVHVHVHVHVHDRDPAKLAALVDRGAVAQPAPALLTAAVDTVIMSLNTAAIVEHVVFGADGVSAAGTADKLLFDMSSIDPDATAVMASCGSAGGRPPRHQ